MNTKNVFSKKNLLIFIYLFFNLPAQAGNLVLWNKLGSENEVLHSVVGANFEIELLKIGPYDPEPMVYYVSGIDGGAVATYGGGDYYGGGGRLTMNPDEFFPSDRTKGTVEVWIQKKIQKLTPYETPLVTIFGGQAYARGEITGYNSITVMWSDGVTGERGLRFYIFDEKTRYHQALDSTWDDVPVDQWIHTAFIWDLKGIGGSSDKMRIYRDGVITARNIDDNISGIYPNTEKVKILAHHASNRFIESTIYLDEIKVWDFAKQYDPPCNVVAYVVHDGGLNDSLLLSVSNSNPKLQFTPLGTVHKGYDLEALALHPQTGELYASSGENSNKPGYLYKV